MSKPIGNRILPFPKMQQLPDYTFRGVSAQVTLLSRPEPNEQERKHDGTLERESECEDKDQKVMVKLLDPRMS